MNESASIYLGEISKILDSLIGQKAIYSQSGGGNGSILLQEFQNGVCIWSWCSYWEIRKYATLIACAEDDITPLVGVVATGAKMMEGKALLGYEIDEDLNLALYFDDYIDYIIFPVKETDITNWKINSKELNVAYELTGDLEIVKSPYYSSDN